MKVIFQFVVCAALLSALVAGDLPKSRSHGFAKTLNRNARQQEPNKKVKALPADFNPHVRTSFAKDLSGVPVNKVKPITKAFMIKESVKPEDAKTEGVKYEGMNAEEVKPEDVKTEWYYSWPSPSPSTWPTPGPNNGNNWPSPTPSTWPTLPPSYYYNNNFYYNPNPGEFIWTYGNTEGHYDPTGKGPHGWANGDMSKPGISFGITPYLRTHYDYINGGWVYTVEWHCLEADHWSGDVVGVHGTYDNLGYFEGNVVEGAAFINYYENTPSWGPHGAQFQPTTGAGVLVYDNDTWLFEGGTSWEAGQTSTYNPYGYTDAWGGWYGVSPCWDCMPDDIYDWELQDWIKFTRKTCLWSPYDRFHRTMDHTLNNEIYGPKANENTWTSDGVGPFQTNGSTIGAYSYTYSDEECEMFEMEGQFSCEEDGRVETGHYNLNAVSAIVGSNRIFVSSWNATSGPLKGQTGPQLGLFQSNVGWSSPDNAVELSSFSGFFCYTTQNYYGDISATGCTSQVSRNKGKDKKEAEKLLSAYDVLKGMKKSGINRLKALVDMIWG